MNFNQPITTFVSLLFVLIFFTESLSQDQKKLDSLTTVYHSMPADSARIRVLVELWRATAYNDTKAAKAYAYQIIKESTQIKYKTGTATGYQRLAIIQDYTGDQGSARQNYLKAIEIYQEINKRKLEASMLYNIGLTYQSESEYDSATYFVNLAKEIFKTEKDTFRLAATFEGLASIDMERGNYRLSLKNALTAAKYLEMIGEEYRLADVKLKIGDAYHQSGRYKEAIAAFKESITIYLQKFDDDYRAQALSKTGMSFHELGQEDSCQFYLKNALEVAKKLNSNYLISATYHSLGISLLENGKYQASIPYFEESLKYAEPIDYKIISAASLINLGIANFEINNISKAEQFAQKGLEIAIETDVKENIRSANKILYLLNKSRGRFDKALQFHETFKTIHDSIYNLDKSRQISEWQTLYETEKKDSEIKDQKAEIDLLNRQAQIDNLRKVLLGSGLIAVMIIAGLAYYGTRQKLKRNQAEREKEAQAFEMEITSKKKELTTHTLHLVQKNELLQDISNELLEIKKEEAPAKQINRLIQVIKNDKQSDKDWENFMIYFEQIHKDFDTKLKKHFNDLTNNEIRLATLMKMNLTTKEIAAILNISPDGVKKARYRLRKKLAQENDENLQSFLLTL